MFKTIVNRFIFPNIIVPVRYLNSNTASVTKIHRNLYARTYPAVVVLADGSTINISYHEPRKIIKMPIDLSKFTEQERKAYIEKRKPKSKVKIEDDYEDNFNANKYLARMKKNVKK